MRRFFAFLVAVVIVGAEPASASSLPPPLADAVKAATAWVQLLDSGKYDQSWKDSATLFQAAMKQEAWRVSVSEVRKPIGKKLARKVFSAQETKDLPGAPPGTYVVIQFQTDFENKKGAIETITPMLDKDGKWRVSGYFIR